MKIAEVFQNNMILQRNKEVLVWGTENEYSKIEVKLNGKLICTPELTKGSFSFYIPPQPATENATLTIGDTIFSNVDFGEVFVASGQSNMEFLLEYEEHYSKEKNAPDDEHLRMYTVGRYSFEGEKELGYKSWNPWDKWYSYTKKDRGYFSAPAAYFAKELRKEGVPVGILNCSWGGTIALAWLSENWIKKEPAFDSQVEYAKKLDAIIEENNLWQAKQSFRQNAASQSSEEGTRQIMTVTTEPVENASDAFDILPSEFKGHGVDPADLLYRAKGDPNYPGVLFGLMLKKILGYTVQGVLWYQGESDQDHAGDYGKIFTALINCWREEWLNVNKYQTELPFIFAQLAPFGQWLYNKGHNFPELRQQQFEVSHNVPDTYIISLGDIGNVYDIHPKNKLDVGHRFALIAQKYIYNKSVDAESPYIDFVTKENDSIKITFKNAEGLYIKEQDNSTYNGFSNIKEEFVPPVTDKINGLKILCDGTELKNCSCSIENNSLIVKSESILKTKKLSVEIGQTAFYKINLFNKAGLPVLSQRVTVELN